MKKYKTKFAIHLPATKTSPAKKVDEIEIECYIDENGDEMVTTASSILIDETKAHHMGIMNGAKIKAMRKRLNLTQDQLSDLLSCGKKSISRWESGRGYPSGIINKMLRLLDNGTLSLASLDAVDGSFQNIKTDPWRNKKATASLDAVDGSFQNIKTDLWRNIGDKKLQAVA